MCMMLKPKCNRRSGWGKDLLDQKTRTIQTTFKVIMTVFFGWKAFSIISFVTRSPMVNKVLYQEVFAPLRYIVRRKRPELWETRFRSCTTKMGRLTSCFSSPVIWQNIRHPFCPIHHTIRIYNQQNLSCFGILKRV